MYRKSNITCAHTQTGFMTENEIHESDFIAYKTESVSLHLSSKYQLNTEPPPSHPRSPHHSVFNVILQQHKVIINILKAHRVTDNCFDSAGSVFTSSTM